ncbi:MAG TPA: hypothetical protein DER60_14745 [Syntrophomonas sp.]|jgi:hypothetical protein|nr:hypothetical protein [Syntrophomonas sp.]
MGVNMRNRKSILMILLAIGSILLGYSYAHELYGPLESEVELWGYFSEGLGASLLILAFFTTHGIGTRLLLYIGTVIQIPPIILWFIFHSGEITDYPPAFSDNFVAHWAFSIPHIFLIILCLWILKLIGPRDTVVNSR